MKRFSDNDCNDIVNNIYKSNNYEEFKVLRFVERRGKGLYYEIKFLKTNYTITVNRDSIFSGKVKDKYVKTVCGVAWLGNANTRNHLREYAVWLRMIHRCYLKTDGFYELYGGIGVSVCNNWLSFENFVQDINKIENYDLWLVNKDYELDKDIKQSDKLNSAKIYSLETCTFISHAENMRHIKRKTRKIRAYSPKGEIFLSDSIKPFAIFNDLNVSAINEVLHGRNKTHKHWKFEYVDEGL